MQVLYNMVSNVVSYQQSEAKDCSVVYLEYGVIYSWQQTLTLVAIIARYSDGENSTRHGPGSVKLGDSLSVIGVRLNYVSLDDGSRSLNSTGRLWN